MRCVSTIHAQKPYTVKMGNLSYSGCWVAYNSATNMGMLTAGRVIQGIGGSGIGGSGIGVLCETIICDLVPLHVEVISCAHWPLGW